MNPYISAPKNLLYFSLLPPVCRMEFSALLFGSRFFTSKTNVFSFDYAALRMAASVDFTPRLFKYIVANSFFFELFFA